MTATYTGVSPTIADMAAREPASTASGAFASGTAGSDATTAAPSAALSRHLRHGQIISCRHGGHEGF
jgi:hypothetical protein